MNDRTDFGRMPDDAIVGYDAEGEPLFPSDERDGAYTAFLDSIESQRRGYDVEAAIGCVLADDEPAAVWAQLKSVVDPLVEREVRRRVAVETLRHERAMHVIRGLEDNLRAYNEDGEQ